MKLISSSKVDCQAKADPNAERGANLENASGPANNPLSSPSRSQNELENIYFFIQQLISNDKIPERELEEILSANTFNLEFTENEEASLYYLIYNSPLPFDNLLEFQKYINRQVATKNEIFVALKEKREAKENILKQITIELEQIKKEYFDVQEQIVKMAPIQKVINPVVTHLSNFILPFKEKYENAPRVEISAMTEEDIFSFWSYAQLPYVEDIITRKIKGEHLEFLSDSDLLNSFKISSFKQRKRVLLQLDLLKYGQLFDYIEQNSENTKKEERKIFKKLKHKTLCSICRHDHQRSFLVMLKENGIQNYFDEKILNSLELTGPEFAYVDISDFSNLQIPLHSRGHLVSVLNNWKTTHQNALEQ